MAEVDYKSLFNQAKVFISSKFDYSKLTLAEKLSIILVQIAIFAIALLIGFSILMFLSFALVNTLSKATDSPALSYLIVAGIWALICLLIFTFKTVLIVNPITRFVTKLMFNTPPRRKQIANEYGTD